MALTMVEIAHAAPTVGEAQVVRQSEALRPHTSALEALTGNGEQVFAAYTHSANRVLLRGGYLREGAVTSNVISGLIPNDPSPAAGSTYTTLAMNANGTVLGVFNSDVFRVDGDGAARSLEAPLLGGEPVPPRFVNGALPALLIGDHGAGAAGHFLLAQCTQSTCSGVVLDDAGAASAEIPLFAFPQGCGTAYLGAMYVQNTGFRVIGACGTTLQRTTVTAAGASAPESTPLPIPCAVSSVRVGGAFVGPERVRVTSTCSSGSWFVNPDGLTENFPYCNNETNLDQCALFSSPQTLLVSRNGSFYEHDVRSTNLPGSPLRVGVGPRYALAFNQPDLYERDPASGAISLITNWRARPVSSQLYLHVSAGQPIARRSYFTEDGAPVLMPGAPPLPSPLSVPVGMLAIGESTLIANSQGLHVIDGSPFPRSASLSGARALGGSPEAPIVVFSRGTERSLLYVGAVTTDAIGAPGQGPLPNTPGALTSAKLLGDDVGALKLAFDGARHLLVYEANLRVYARLLEADGTPVGEKFPLAESVYRQRAPQVLALPTGGFFVGWIDQRRSASDDDLYGAFVDREGTVSPDIAVSTSPNSASAFTLGSGADADHVSVAWNEISGDRRALLQLSAVSVSRSQLRARTPVVVDASLGDHVPVGIDVEGAQINVLYMEYGGGPRGGDRVLSRTVDFGVSAGRACTADADCISGTCVGNVCGEREAPPVTTPCDQPCAMADTDGSCITAPRGTLPRGDACPGFLCDGRERGCPTGCQSNEQCTGNAECVDGACSVVRECRGANEVTERGVTRSCGALRCDPKRAECFERCMSNAECVDGLVCDEVGACVTAPSAEEGCNAGHSSAWTGLAGLLMLLGRRRRRIAQGIGGAALLLACLTPSRARAQDRVGPATVVTPVAGDSFNPFGGVDLWDARGFALPGPDWRAIVRYNRRDEWTEAVLGEGGIEAWRPAPGQLQRIGVCADGSVLALERSYDNLAGEHVWLLHFVDGATPAHRLEVPLSASYTLGSSCTSDGAWLRIAEATDIYTRYEWASGAVVERVDTHVIGTTPLFDDRRIAWVFTRPGSFVIGSPAGEHADLPVASNYRAYSVGSAAIVGSVRFVPGLGNYNMLGAVVWTEEGPSYQEALNVNLPNDLQTESLAVSGRTVLFRTYNLLGRINLDGNEPQLTTRGITPGWSLGAVMRGEVYDVFVDNFSRTRYGLDLEPIDLAWSAPITKRPRELWLASGTSGASARLLGMQSDDWVVTQNANVTPINLEGLLPTDLQALDDGRAIVIARDWGDYGRGFALDNLDVRTELPALDGNTRVVPLGDGFAAAHMIPFGNQVRYTLRHVSATLGVTGLDVLAPAPELEIDRRTNVALAARGNEAFAVITVGVASYEQHLDWSHIQQGEVTEAAPLTRRPGRQRNPAIACDPRGVRGCLVVWEDAHDSPYTSDIMGARILPDRSLPDGDGFVIAASDALETSPAVIWSDDDDHFFVAWRSALHSHERRPDRDPSHLRGAFVRFDGTVEDPEGIALTDEPLDEHLPFLYGAAQGSFALAYQVFSVADGSTQWATRALNAGKLRGASCGGDAECAGRACIDGICCEASCRGGCGVCNTPGQLGQCTPKAAGAASHADTCQPFVCDGRSTTCPTSCARDEDCIEGASCDPQTRQCVTPVVSAFCIDADTADVDGTPTACAPYRCARGGCAERCTSNDECAIGAVCTLGGMCETSPPADDAGCQTAGAPSSALLLMLVLGGLARQRRRVPS